MLFVYLEISYYDVLTLSRGTLIVEAKDCERY